MTCSVNEAQNRITPQEFLNWVEFYKANPPMREFINICQANIAYTISCVNRSRGQKIIPLSKFIIDLKELTKTDDEKVEDQLRRFFTGPSKKG